ncbi:hypothetical protein [Acidocella facilis]|uniref:hypothetical protein n=1 Tax=Acidocella facilis TaxID=525 RepID=UPI001F29998B|nr:hypothetical protein [Acidocella facilis]
MQKALAPLPPLPRIAMFTWFGTLICLDTRSSSLVHRAPDALEPQHIVLGLEPTPTGAILSVAHAERATLPNLPSTLVIQEGHYQGSLLFHGDELFLVARSDGELSFLSAAAKEWEHFLPVPARDVELIHRIVAQYWSVNGASPVKAGFCAFNLFFGDHVVELPGQLPLPLQQDLATLELQARDGALRAVPVPGWRGRKQVWIHPHGNIGNRALQYLTAEGIARRVAGAVVTNIQLPMWQREAPAPRPPARESAGTGDDYHLDVAGLAACLDRDEVDAICLEGYCFHVAHYPSRATCRALLPPVPGQEAVQGFGPGQLVCSVRANEILNGEYPGYFPLPPAYYAKLQEESGLELVFYGQLGEDPYSAGLRAAFPRAQFVAGTSPGYDFEVLRRSANLALSISTFSWLAAWLSEAQRIYVPVGGMFSPVLQVGQLYLPLEEPAFRYVLLPPVTAVGLQANPARFWQMQDLLGAQARFATAQELRDMLARLEKRKPSRIELKDFDGTRYLARNADAALDVREGRGTALAHYLAIGARREHVIQNFDPLFYARTYPDASEAVALGHYDSLLAHFRDLGAALGYQPAA